MARIAVLQFEPVFGDVAGNIAATVRLISEAAAQGAELVVLPELCNSGYMFSSETELADLAEVVGEGPASLAWTAAAARLGVHVVAGLTEEDDGRYFNTAVMVGPGGVIAKYRKVHLWDAEARWFTPGDLGFPVADTHLGRVGMLVCYDGWFPESYRSLVLQGADIVCVPTNWVPIPGQAEGQQAMATILSMASAHSNGLVVAAADRTGTERGQKFIGQSLIVSHTGWPLAGPAAEDGTAVLTADVDVAAIRASRTWNDNNDPVLDRRPETYTTGRGHPSHTTADA